MRTAPRAIAFKKSKEDAPSKAAAALLAATASHGPAEAPREQHKRASRACARVTNGNMRKNHFPPPLLLIESIVLNATPCQARWKAVPAQALVF